VLGNPTGSSAVPVAITVAAESVVGRTSGNVDDITSSVQTALIRGAGSMFWASCANDQVLRRSGAGDLGFGTLVTNNIGTNQVTNARLAQIATPRLKGRTTAATGDVEDLTLTNSTSVTWNTATGGTVSLERAALTGEGTASANANTITITRSTNFQSAPWTGSHQFEGAVVGFGVFDFTTVGATTSNLAIGAVNCVRIDCSGISDVLTGMVASFDGQWVWLENVDSAVGLTIAHDATSTAANRFYCPVTQNFFLPARTGLWCRYDGTLARWILSDTKQTQGFTVVDVAGATTTSGGGTLAFASGSNTTWGITSSLTAPGVRFDIACNVSANPTFDAVLINEQATSATSVPAGDGMFWVRSDTPNVPMWTDDSNLDYPLRQCYAQQTTTTSISAATTLMDTTTVYTAPASTLVVGSRFRCTYALQFVRGATATAMNIDCFFDVGSFPSLAVTTPTAAGTYMIRVEADFTILTTGGSGTAMCAIDARGDGVTGGTTTGTSVTLAINTTAALAMGGVARMASVVTGTSIRPLGGHIEWIR
jgi:hypothetical protein